MIGCGSCSDRARSRRCSTSRRWMDLELRATMDVLTALASPAMFTDENLFRLVVCRMANISLRARQQRRIVLRLCVAGRRPRGAFGDYPAGFRFGRLGLDLVEKRGLDRFRARVYMVFGHRLAHWTQHLATCRRLLAARFRGGAGSRRSHLCGLQLQHPDHAPARLRRAARRQCNERPSRRSSSRGKCGSASSSTSSPRSSGSSGRCAG